jgi:hypothetical protein
VTRVLRLHPDDLQAIVEGIWAAVAPFASAVGNPDATLDAAVGLLREADPAFPRRGLVEVDDVGRLLRVEREWVYEHKRELGAVRIGDGERGPLRFDAAKVLAYIEAHRIDGKPEPRQRRRPARSRRRPRADFDLLQIPDR